MNYVLNYFQGNQFSNYSLLNETNIFNSLLSIFELLKDEKDKVKFIDILIIQCGNTFINNFKSYVFRKIPSHNILSFF
jgi:hypothetical protein